MSISIRQFIFQTLLPFETTQSHRRHMEEALDKGYSRHGFSLQDKGFGTYLAYGVLRHWFLLDGVIGSLSRIPVQKLEPKVRLLLKMGLYQLAAMESVPDYAAVSETMALAEILSFSAKSRGFVHALLQRFIREQKPWPSNPETAYPAWWLKRLSSQYAETEVTQILSAFRETPRLSIRVNTLKTSVLDYTAALTTQGIEFKPSETIGELLHLSDSVGDPRQLPGYEAGYFVVQDESSAAVTHALNPQPREKILEIGAAPGMKTTHMAAFMQNQGEITAVDTSEKRLKLLLQNCERLGVNNVKSVVADGQALSKDLSSDLFDRVLVDAPCSGTGTMGKHPEILLLLEESAFGEYQQTQLTLLSKAFSFLKPGGVLVYSTCSIDAAENHQVVEKFLSKHPKAVLVEEKTILPASNHDGFFIMKVIC